MREISSAKKMINILDKLTLINPQAKILDLGCGSGKMLNDLIDLGYDAYGCDYINDEDVSEFTSEVKQQFNDRKVMAIEEPYRLPFKDNMFDYIISMQVFEHVMDYDLTIKEIHRILKPNGINVNIFPGRYRLIENHVGVPLATIIRNKTWLYLWALLGIKNQYQEKTTALERTNLNYKYLREHTNYPTRKKLLSYCVDFSEADFREDVFLQTLHSRKAKLLKLMWKVFPYTPTLISDFYSRVMVLKK